ncbi:DUF7837 family putative zinc-binding protein [Haloarchaeobius litoreus]|uniref:DUF7837 family putative zinc-binding protein n=1 Tax=Haloarchaeobius litoreus TaxID=755306 RepID=UPI003F5DC2B7
MSHSPETDSSDRHELGGCPHCGTRLARGDVLISYTGGDQQRHWVDCPNCREVVHPQGVRE